MVVDLAGIYIKLLEATSRPIERPSVGLPTHWELDIEGPTCGLRPHRSPVQRGYTVLRLGDGSDTV